MKATAEEKKMAFVKSAHEAYLEATAKTYEELNEEGYLSYGRYSWADGLTGDEWPTIEYAQMCGEEAASQAIEAEQ